MRNSDNQEFNKNSFTEDIFYTLQKHLKRLQSAEDYKEQIKIEKEIGFDIELEYGTVFLGAIDLVIRLTSDCFVRKDLTVTRSIWLGDELINEPLEEDELIYYSLGVELYYPINEDNPDLMEIVSGGWIEYESIPFTYEAFIKNLINDIKHYIREKKDKELIECMSKNAHFRDEWDR